MQKNADIILENDTLFLKGDLCFANVMSVYEKSLQQLNAINTKWILDFSHLTSSDSSGLALILEWIKFAKQSRRAIQFEHLSRDLLSLARAASMQVLFESPE